MSNHYIKKYSESSEVFVDFTEVSSFFSNAKDEILEVVILTHSGNKVTLRLSDSEYKDFKKKYVSYLSSKEKGFNTDIKALYSQLQQDLTQLVNDSELKVFKQREEFYQEFSEIKAFRNHLDKLVGFIDTFVGEAPNIDELQKETEQELQEKK